MTMNKLKMHSPDLTQSNIAKVAELFPNCITEVRIADGATSYAIDFDQLRQELSTSVVEGPQERYQINWPGKREALLTANAPIAKTLRPCREESLDFDTTQNLFIEGDNLDALKLLQETYLNKVKLIYIDPPYNTGNDFIYEDDFAEDSEAYKLRSNQNDESGNRLTANTEANGRFHSDWMSMIYSRLKLARNLLCDDGFIFISIDNGEASNLRKIADEVFGESNFVECITWKKKYGGGAKTKYFVGLHEYILCYSKNKQLIEKIEIPYGEANRKYYKYEDEKLAVRGPYRLQPLNTNSNDHRENLIFPIAFEGEEIWPESQWQWSKQRVELAAENNELVITRTKNGTSVNFKQYLRDEDGEERTTKPFSIIDGIYTQHGTTEIKELFGDGKTFSFPKPTELLTSLIRILGPGDHLVLDFFSGSATTANAIFKLNAEDGGNRRFILVQVPEKCDSESVAFKSGYKTIAEIGKARIRLSGAKVLGGVCAEKWKKDVGFRTLKIDSSNMKEVFYTPDAVAQDQLFDQVNNIREDRTSEDLLFQVLLDWGVDLALPIAKETIDGKTVYFVDGNALAACFDEGVSEEFVKRLAKREPLRVVFRDAGFATDSVKINVEQIFKLMSPSTDVKTI
jgi:adenine-specific DNA-methyltransferase